VIIIRSSDPLFLFPRGHNVLQETAVFAHLRNGFAFLEKGAGRAYLDALAAPGTRVGIAPRFTQVGNDERIEPSPADIPGVGAFNLVAYPDAPGAQDATMVIEAEALVTGVRGEFRKLIAQADVVDAQIGG